MAECECGEPRVAPEEHLQLDSGGIPEPGEQNAGPRPRQQPRVRPAESMLVSRREPSEPGLRRQCRAARA